MHKTIYFIDYVVRSESPPAIRIERKGGLVSVYEERSSATQYKGVGWASLIRLSATVNRLNCAEQGSLFVHADGWTYMNLS